VYRLLIADDEPLEREGLEWIVRRAMPNTFQVLHADSGRAAIALAEEHRPHIVLMDIHMPGISGLAALREMQAIVPDAKLVLVTAYDYFAYAQEAVALGVKEYIVKPAHRDHIVRTLERLTEQLEQEKRKREAELELLHKVSRLEPMAENELALTLMAGQVHATDARELSDWLSFPLDRGFAVVAAFPRGADDEDSQALYETVRRFAKTHALPGVVSSLMDKHMAAFYRVGSPVEPDRWRSGTAAFAEKLADVVRRQFGLTVALGVGSIREGAAGFRTSYFEAVLASTFVPNGDAAAFFEDVAHAATVPEGGSAGEPNEPGSYVVSALQRIRDERERRTLTVLDRAKRYIRERYTKDLSLEEVAEHVHLNPYYFSKVFKQQVGDSFIDFLTRLRIDKAKELIAEGRLSLKEICFEVGYRDPNYFSRVFKKVTGLTPTEYRQQER